MLINWLNQPRAARCAAMFVLFEANALLTYYNLCCGLYDGVYNNIHILWSTFPLPIKHFDNRFIPSTTTAFQTNEYLSHSFTLSLLLALCNQNAPQLTLRTFIWSSLTASVVDEFELRLSQIPFQIKCLWISDRNTPQSRTHNEKLLKENRSSPCRTTPAVNKPSLYFGTDVARHRNNQARGTGFAHSR